MGEEELQLQLALAMSREEAEQEEQRRRSDDVRLQLALSQSQQDFKCVVFVIRQLRILFSLGISLFVRTPQPEKQSHMLDLLDVNLGEASGPVGQVDPWGMPIAAPPPRPQVSIALRSFSSHETVSLLHAFVAVFGFVLVLSSEGTWIMF